MSLVSSFPHCNAWVMSSHSRSKDHLNRRPSFSRDQAKTRTQFNCHGITSSLSVEHLFWDSVDDSQGFVGKENEDDLSEHSEMISKLMALWKLITKLQESDEKTDTDKKLPLATEFLTTEHKLKLDNETGTCADTVRVCSCLGLRFDFLDHLGNFSRRIRNHRSIRDWIVKFLWENYESLRFDEKGSLTKELLLAIGFESMSSIETVLTRSLAGNMQRHLEAWEWAAIFVEDEFKYNLLLSSEVESQNNSLNEDEGVVKIRNVSVEKGAMHEKTGSILSELCMEQDQFTVYFHGTDHDSAKDILQRGVDLTTGRQRRDFSSGLGFYVTKDFRIALNWAKSITSKPALLIFQVQRSFPDRFRKRSFLENCANDMMEWEKVVASFRSGNITPEIQKLVKDLDFMEGPEAILTGRNEIDELIFERKPRSHQMCFFSETIAEEFGRSLNSMIFYRLF